MQYISLNLRMCIIFVLRTMIKYIVVQCLSWTLYKSWRPHWYLRRWEGQVRVVPMHVPWSCHREGLGGTYTGPPKWRGAQQTKSGTVRPTAEFDSCFAIGNAPVACGNADSTSPPKSFNCFRWPNDFDKEKQSGSFQIERWSQDWQQRILRRKSELLKGLRREPLNQLRLAIC